MEWMLSVSIENFGIFTFVLVFDSLLTDKFMLWQLSAVTLCWRSLLNRLYFYN